MSKQKILITGITGQDGVFLTKKLLHAEQFPLVSIIKFGLVFGRRQFLHHIKFII